MANINNEIPTKNCILNVKHIVDKNKKHFEILTGRQGRANSRNKHNIISLIKEEDVEEKIYTVLQFLYNQNIYHLGNIKTLGEIINKKWDKSEEGIEVLYDC